MFVARSAGVPSVMEGAWLAMTLTLTAAEVVVAVMSSVALAVRV